MKKRKILSSAGILSLAGLTLAACGNQNNNNANSDNAKKASKFPSSMSAKKAKKGGTVKWAIELTHLLLVFLPVNSVFENRY